VFLPYIKRSSGTTRNGRALDVTPAVRSRLASRTHAARGAEGVR
jgi:hypothetical protein